MSQMPPQYPGEQPANNQGMYYNPLMDSAKDANNLKNLSIGFIVWGCIITFFSLFFLIYIFVGLEMQQENFGLQRNYIGPSEETIGRIFMIIGGVGFVLGELIGILTIVAGVNMKKYKNRMLILIVAGVNCLSLPFGTTLGVITFVVMSKPGAKALFDR